MRRKPNREPRMERCAHWQITGPQTLRGRWLEEFKEYKELRLELGCGKGRFTCEQAQREPDVLLVAVEKVPDAMVVAMERAQELGVENVRFIDMDAADLRDVFAPGEVSRIYINFPDPWRKTRQYKRRLTAGSFLSIYREILAEDAGIWFKTDNPPLFNWSLWSFDVNGWSCAPMPEGTPMTDYEAKFTAMGMPIFRTVAAPDREAVQRTDLPEPGKEEEA